MKGGFQKKETRNLRPPYDLPGRLEAKVKSFCAIPRLLSFLKDYILFAEKDEELNKYILHQHQTGAVERVVRRALDPERRRGLRPLQARPRRIPAAGGRGFLALRPFFRYGLEDTTFERGGHAAV